MIEHNFEKIKKIIWFCNLNKTEVGNVGQTSMQLFNT